MRMWMLPPRLLCRQHLLGEHAEIHKFRPSFEKRHDMTRRIELEQIEPRSMKRRHDVLVEEILRRGYNHDSPYELPDLSYIDPELLDVSVSRLSALFDLLARCDDCWERFVERRWREKRTLDEDD